MKQTQNYNNTPQAQEKKPCPDGVDSAGFMFGEIYSPSCWGFRKNQVASRKDENYLISEVKK
jgi:hypothetical protein